MNNLHETILLMLVDIILNNTEIDYNGALTIENAKPILEFVRAWNASDYEKAYKKAKEALEVEK